MNNVTFSDDNAKAIVFSTLENKKVLAQAQSDKISAHAGMVAMDSYIEALEVRLQNIENEMASASAAEKESDDSGATTSQEPAENQQVTAPNVAGLSSTQFVSTEENEEAGTSIYTCTINGATATVVSTMQDLLPNTLS